MSYIAKGGNGDGILLDTNSYNGGVGTLLK